MGNKTTAYKYNKNDELLRTDTLNSETEKNEVVICKNDKNGNQLATVNRYEIPSGINDENYIDVDVTLGDNQLNDNVVNHYNALNQLTRTFTKNYKVSFTYDAEGLRTSKTVNGEKTIFVWDGDQVVMELSKGGTVQNRYIRGNDLVFADRGENTEKTYYVTDTHGNVVQLLDENGSVTKIYEYDSFGNEVDPDKKDENPFRYCGEYFDKETGRVYLRARYYQPTVSRFITRDTYTGEGDDPLSLHLYTYCENDGVNNEDPSGHVVETIADIASIGYSTYEFVKDPSWGNAGYLAWDIGAAVIPVAPGSYTVKGGKTVYNAVRNSKLSAKIGSTISKLKGKFGAVVTFGKKHFSSGRNAGQFTISVDKLKSILKRKDIINTLGVPSTTSGQYTRIVNAGEVVGTIKPSIPKVGGKPTKWLTIITDVKGNLITTYPCPAP